jgi:hypothetical protein
MRISLGAARTRLVRQMSTESLLLSLLAGGLGWLVARSAGPLLVSLLSRDTDPIEFVLSIDTGVLLFLYRCLHGVGHAFRVSADVTSLWRPAGNFAAWFREPSGKSSVWGGSS